MIEHPSIRRERTNLKKTLENTRKLQAAGQYPLEFQMPTGIQFELTGACNLRCKHCYNRSGEADVQTRMKPEDWIALSHHLVENGGVFQCILSGGEPLLMGDTLIEIMDILHEDNTGFLLISNGLLMTNEWVKKFKKYPFYWIQISIDDSRREKHDSFRGREGSWDAATKAAIQISSAGLPLTIAHTITPDNIGRFDEMVEFAYQLGASTLMCSETLISGRGAKNNELWLNDEQRNLMYTLIEQMQAQWSGKIRLLYSIPDGIQSEQRQYLPNRSVIIRPNGDVRMDCTMPFTIGNVLEKPFIEIWREKGATCWQNPKVRDYIQNILTNNSPDFINHVNTDHHI
ncbi:MAG: radical SAM protein [Thermoguttaceae bacterium]|nr:radical SAM protein [Thermoguttaceae bacterium]